MAARLPAASSGPSGKSAVQLWLTGAAQASERTASLRVPLTEEGPLALPGSRRGEVPQMTRARWGCGEGPAWPQRAGARCPAGQGSWPQRAGARCPAGQGSRPQHAGARCPAELGAWPQRAGARCPAEQGSHCPVPIAGTSARGPEPCLWGLICASSAGCWTPDSDLTAKNGPTAQQEAECRQ